MTIGSLRSSITRELARLRLLIRRRTFVSPKTEKDIVDNFHKLYYDSHLFDSPWRKISWMGVPIHKCPFDSWVYHELIYKLRPSLIIECGTMFGGNALFLASMCDLVNHGSIVTIDIEERDGRPTHPRILYLTGSSTSEEIIAKVRRLVKEKKEGVLVILDSDHSRDHVLKEMQIYGNFVTTGSYMIVEDSNMNGHPVAPEFGPGPMEAIKEFLKTNGEFEIDKTQEKLYITFNPNGYLRKVK